MTTKNLAWNVKTEFRINRDYTVQILRGFHNRICYEQQHILIDHTMVDVVTVVSSGSLGIELDLEVVTQEFGELVDYDPGKYPGAYFDSGSPSR